MKFIKNVKADGGEDFCEAIVDGFKAISELNWQEKTLKYIYHIADAPPHGTIYHGDDLDYF